MFMTLLLNFYSNLKTPVRLYDNLTYTYDEHKMLLLLT